MKIKNQAIILFLVSITLMLSLLFYVVRPMLIEEANSIDRMMIKQNIDRIDNFIELEKGSLKRLNRDWGFWDDTYQFINGENPEYIESNLGDETFINNQLEYMIFFDNQEKILFQKGYNYEQQSDMVVSQTFTANISTIMERRDADEDIFLVKNNAGLVIVSVLSVHLSDGSGESPGKIVMGRMVNQAYVDKIGEALSLDLSLLLPSSDAENSITIIDENQINGTLILNDEFNQKSAQIILTKDRTFYQEKIDNVHTFLFYLTISLFIVSFMIFGLFQYFFVRPVSHLALQTKKIKFEDNLSNRVQSRSTHNKEIKELEGSINTMLTTLELTHGEVLDLAYHDQLTGLSNRSYLYKEFPVLAKEVSNDVAILFFDLDGFKRVNDTWGHGIGDQLLKTVSKRLRKMIKAENSIISRIGGDEFVIVLPFETRADLETVVVSTMKELNVEYRFGHIHTFVSTSVGVSLYPTDSPDFESALKHADIAMYEAKVKGKNQIVFYEDLSSENEYQNLLMLKNDLIYSLERDQLTLNYQPIMDMNGEYILGVEALLRWNHPEHGMVPPSEFIPMMEEADLMGEVGIWVLREAVTQVKKWHLMGDDNLSLAINFSKTQLRKSDDFLQEMDRLLADTLFPPERLQIEITESDIYVFDEDVVSFVKEIQKRGVKISLDDFGVGTSSLYSLRDIPVDIVKMDRSFISRIPSQSFDMSLLIGLYKILQDLNIEVITEGIETVEQLNFVKKNSQSFLQGYYFSKPMRPLDLEKRIKNVVY
ncbi:EAL domain-containing protein [Virgibacillus flavescens]|uniref:EAL domain-containing protein n=1 Tax=Virgibacillus flavescens TaxID=1611422 RepID=UPI003D33699D